MKNFLKCVIKILLSTLPINKKKIVFVNFSGKGYGCNPKYIAEYLRKNDKFNLIWLCKDQAEEMPFELKKVHYGSIAAWYELSTAKVWIMNVRNQTGIKKRKGQFYIQTWHASYSQKYLEAEAKNLPEVYREYAKKDSKEINLFLSNSKLQTEDIKKNFWYDGEIFECGYPRNDVIIKHKNDSNFIQAIKKKLSISLTAKILLFAPTFRDNGKDNIYMINFEKLKKKYEEICHSECIILLRFHPNVKKIEKNMMDHMGVIDVSNYPDMQELLLLSDLLVTDYSSSLFDFSILNRPIIIYAPDIEEYKRSRGLKPIFEKIPYPISRCEEELYYYIENYESTIDKRKVKNFFEYYGSCDQGNATEKVEKRIKRIMKGKEK